MSDTNELGQPVGERVVDWSPRQAPSARVLQGRWCRLDPLDPGRHADDLYRANSRDDTGRIWTYLPYGPFADAAAYRKWAEHAARREDAVFFAVVEEPNERAGGVLALQRVEVSSGSVEVAHLTFSPGLQDTTAATEAIFLVMSLVFDELGYRRLEWKCDALNAPSRKAASRFGFVYEGTFRQAVVVKGRNRDTAWYSITDSDWHHLKGAYQRWLSPANFDQDGRQRLALSDLTAAGPTPPDSARDSSGVDGPV
ncbi:MAG: GNAT family N-acetyltransferase [Acidimicrobiales bacterium]